MAFEKSVLKDVGGFDPRFRAAGDDVDVCWELQKRGFKLGFHPGALVWHHRRSSLTKYWKQQVGYGKAEALLEEKWPAKYNSVGHLTWGGRIYGQGLTASLPGKPWRVYHGVWGTVFKSPIFWLIPMAMVGMALAFVWEPLFGYLRTGKVYEHWSRFLAMMFLLSVAATLIVTKILDFCLNLLADRLAFLRHAPPQASSRDKARAAPASDERSAPIEQSAWHEQAGG